VARVLIDAADRSGDDLPDSILLVEGGRVFDRSTAALRISRRLKWPWKLAYVLILVPRSLRDFLYDGIARRRHAWFGRSEACLVATPELRSRFLS
jgi:predicted DCC family thiol-disulfide oxidoreductase YuxK